MTDPVRLPGYFFRLAATDFLVNIGCSHVTRNRTVSDDSGGVTAAGLLPAGGLQSR
jgi:hypothetical protein